MHVFKAYNCTCAGTGTLKVINNGGRSKEDTVHTCTCRCDTRLKSDYTCPLVFILHTYNVQVHVQVLYTYMDATVTQDKL